VFEPDAQDLVAAGRVKGVGRIPGPAGDGIAVDAGVVLDANQDRVVTFADPAPGSAPGSAPGCHTCLGGRETA
jgi:hypothetical protein